MANINYMPEGVPVCWGVNVASTFHLGLKYLDLMALVKMFPETGIFYNPNRFAAAIININMMSSPLGGRFVALIFTTSRVVLTGANTIEGALCSAWYLAAMLCRLGIPATVANFRVQNVVVTADLRYHINLTSLQKAAKRPICEYDELFPAARIRLWPGSPVALVNTSGRIVGTGFKGFEAMARAKDYHLRIHAICKRHRHLDNTSTASASRLDKRRKCIQNRHDVLNVVNSMVTDSEMPQNECSVPGPEMRLLESLGTDGALKLLAGGSGDNDEQEQDDVD
jgi:TATA-box binding protein (TBP) (component of TFIID and TFIIIB)